MKHPRAEALERRLLAERARLRDELAAVEQEIVETGEGSEVVAVERVEIARIEKALLSLQEN